MSESIKVPRLEAIETIAQALIDAVAEDTQEASTSAQDAASEKLKAREWAESNTAPEEIVGAKSAKTHATEAGVSSATATTQAGIATTKANEAAASADLFDGFMEKHYPAVPHERRVITDSGTLRNNASALVRILDFVQSNGLQEATEVLICPEATGTKVGAVAGRLSKAYSILKKTRDATQTTAVNQPYLSGHIAPNERLSSKKIKGTNLGIDFSRTEIVGDFSASFVLGLEERSPFYNIFIADATNNGCWISISNVIFYIRFQGGVILTSNDFVRLGKKSIFSISRTGSVLSLYRDGVFLRQMNGANGAFSANRIHAFNNGPDAFFGSISYTRIQRGAMTLEQVQAEHAMLRGLFPEVESVRIGSQEWGTSNLEIVTTPANSTIANVTAGSSVETVTNGNFESGLVGTFSNTGQGLVGSYTLNTTNPISGSQDGLVSITTAAANTTSYIINIPNLPPGRWHRLSFDVKHVSGTAQITGFWIGVSFVPQALNITGTHTYTAFYKSSGSIGGSNVPSAFYPNSMMVGSFQIDNISQVTLGWADAPTIYNHVYTTTTGTHTQKHLAALKEAAMWCYYDNSANNGAIYGKLYNGYALQLLALELGSGYGWKIPTNAEVDALLTTLANNTAPLKHDGTTYWTETNTGTNTSGFTLLPSGFRSTDGSFIGINQIGLIGATTGVEPAEGIQSGDLLPTIGRPTRLLKI
jgi:uncharacterized protein (TIGR02145 family)